MLILADFTVTSAAAFTRIAANTFCRFVVALPSGTVRLHRWQYDVARYEKFDRPICD